MAKEHNFNEELTNHNPSELTVVITLLDSSKNLSVNLLFIPTVNLLFSQSVNFLNALSICLLLTLSMDSGYLVKFPKPLAAEIAVSTVSRFAAGNNGLKEVIFVCFDEVNYQLYTDLLKM